MDVGLPSAMIRAITIRPARETDLASIARIQEAAREAAQWPPESYLEHNCLIAEDSQNVLGFLVWRKTAEDEWEILNLAVNSFARRKGVARRLVQYALDGLQGACFLEVRESNEAAIALYRALGFEVSGRRKKYYNAPPESGIVMKFNS